MSDEDRPGWVRVSVPAEMQEPLQHLAYQLGSMEPAERQQVMETLLSALNEGACAEIIALLRTVMQEEFINEWLDQPVPALDGDTPRQRMQAGDTRSVYQLVARLVSPGGL